MIKRMLKDMITGGLLCLIFCGGMYSGSLVYKHYHPVIQPRILKEYEIVSVDSLNSAWYEYTLYDERIGIFDSIQVQLPDKFVVGYDKLKLIK